MAVYLVRNTDFMNYPGLAQTYSGPAAMFICPHLTMLSRSLWYASSRYPSYDSEGEERAPLRGISAPCCAPVASSMFYDLSPASEPCLTVITRLSIQALRPAFYAQHHRWSLSPEWSIHNYCLIQWRVEGGVAVEGGVKVALILLSRQLLNEIWIYNSVIAFYLKNKV